MQTSRSRTSRWAPRRRASPARRPPASIRIGTTSRRSPAGVASRTSHPPGQGVTAVTAAGASSSAPRATATARNQRSKRARSRCQPGRRGRAGRAARSAPRRPKGAKALARSVPLALEGLLQPHVGEQPCGHRRQQLADPRRRLRPALHHHRATQRCQVQRRRAAGRPGTDDEDLGRGHLSRAGPSGSVAPSRSPRDPAPCAPGQR